MSGIESKLQSKILSYARSLGLLAIKHQCCSMRGFPDVQIFLPCRKILLFECKASKSCPLSPLQTRMHLKLRKFGAKVFIVWDAEGAFYYIDLYLSCYRESLFKRSLPDPYTAILGPFEP